MILEPLIAAKAKERQGQRNDLNIRENSRECLEKGRTDESLAQIAGIGDIEDGPVLDQPPQIWGDSKIGESSQQKSRGDKPPALFVQPSTARRNSAMVAVSTVKFSDVISAHAGSPALRTWLKLPYLSRHETTSFGIGREAAPAPS